MSIIPVILAAGKGTRMKSDLPKVLHPVLGKAMICWVLDEIAQVTDVKPVVVVGHGAQQVVERIKDRAIPALQREQLGTANAVQAAEEYAFGCSEYVLVAYADMPCLSARTIQAVCDSQRTNGGAFAMLTIIQEDSHGFGRIIRASDASVCAIVEEAQCTPQQLEIKEGNVGVYCFQATWLWQALGRVKVSPKGEYYLTDLVELANEDGLKVSAIILNDIDEALGVNNRIHLAEAEAVNRKRLNSYWMTMGVTMIDPHQTYIGADVKIGADVTLLPGCVLSGRTEIGANSVIGPYTVINDSKIGASSVIRQSSVCNQVLPDHAVYGPFVNIK